MAASIPVATLDGAPQRLDTPSATALHSAARSWERRGGPHRRLSAGPWPASPRRRPRSTPVLNGAAIAGGDPSHPWSSQ
jgi:hypothetical protein